LTRCFDRPCTPCAPRACARVDSASGARAAAGGVCGAVTRGARQERAELAERLAGPPDAVPRWHRSSNVIGAGPSGYVYQVPPRA
jgi:hypothetical protein